MRSIRTSTIRTRSSARRPGTVLALAALVAAGAACGSTNEGADPGGSTDGVASLRETSGEQTDVDGSAEESQTSAELEAPEDPDEAFALFDQCLQDHGVDPGEGFVVAGGDVALGVAPENRSESGDGPSTQIFTSGEGPGGTLPEMDEEFLAANEACRGHLANVTRGFDLTPEQEAAMEDAQLAFQQCMSEHGIEGGGFSISVGAGPALGVEEAPDAEEVPPPPADFDPEEFAAAAEQCQSVYDDYPELDGVIPEGAPGVMVSRAENAGDS